MFLFLTEFQRPHTSPADVYEHTAGYRWKTDRLFAKKHFEYYSFLQKKMISRLDLLSPVLDRFASSASANQGKRYGKPSAGNDNVYFAQNYSCFEITAVFL